MFPKVEQTNHPMAKTAAIERQCVFVVAFQKPRLIRSRIDELAINDGLKFVSHFFLHLSCEK